MANLQNLISLLTGLVILDYFTGGGVRRVLASIKALVPRRRRQESRTKSDFRTY
jgi:hypothetical protein